MPYNENQTCSNCYFMFMLDSDRIKRCRFHAPLPKTSMAASEDTTRLNVTLYPRCPHTDINSFVGIGCGQWKTNFEEPEIEPEIELPDRVDKDEKD